MQAVTVCLPGDSTAVMGKGEEPARDQATDLSTDICMYVATHNLHLTQITYTYS